FFFFSSRRRHTRFSRDWSSDVCSSDLAFIAVSLEVPPRAQEHHVIGARVPESLPLHHVLRESREGTLARLSLPEIARAEGAERRSEERRVGKEWRWRWAADRQKQEKTG